MAPGQETCRENPHRRSRGRTQHMLDQLPGQAVCPSSISECRHTPRRSEEKHPQTTDLKTKRLVRKKNGHKYMKQMQTQQIRVTSLQAVQLKTKKKVSWTKCHFMDQYFLWIKSESAIKTGFCTKSHQKLHKANMDRMWRTEQTQL